MELQEKFINEMEHFSRELQKSINDFRQMFNKNKDNIDSIISVNDKKNMKIIIYNNIKNYKDLEGQYNNLDDINKKIKLLRVLETNNAIKLLNDDILIKCKYCDQINTNENGICTYKNCWKYNEVKWENITLNEIDLTITKKTYNINKLIDLPIGKWKFVYD